MAKFAENLRVLRDSLGLSQAQMGRVLGDYGGNTYQMWEKGSRPPAEVREQLAAVGADLHWLDTGEGAMLRPGVSRIQVIRDDKGKPIKIAPITGDGYQQKQQRDTVGLPTREQLRREAQAYVDEVVDELATPQQRADYLQLIDRVADLLEVLHAQGRSDQIRPTLQSLLPASKATGKTKT